jgi:hypothetical protein
VVQPEVEAPPRRAARARLPQRRVQELHLQIVENGVPVAAMSEKYCECFTSREKRGHKSACKSRDKKVVVKEGEGY